MKTIKKDDFLKLLVFLNGATSQKNIIEQSDHFVFTGSHIATYNDFICIFAPFKTDSSFAVPSEEFISLVEKLKDEQFEFTVARENIKIKGLGIKAKIVARTDFEEIGSFIDKTIAGSKKGKWKDLPQDFMDGLSLCSFSASRNLSERELNCVSIKRDVVSSSDRVRISQYMMASEVDDNLMLPLNTVRELLKFRSEKVTKYKLVGSWIYIYIEPGYVFCSRFPNQEYRSLNGFFDFKKRRIGKFPKSLSDAIDISSIFADGEFDVDKLINIEIDGIKKEIRLSSENAVGGIEKEVEFKNAKLKRKVEIKINPIFLKEVLQRDPIVSLGDDRMQFNSKRFKHLMVLIREQ